MPYRRSKKPRNAPWERASPRPARTRPKRLTAAEKKAARRSARAAGRRYPNLVDNMRVIKRRGARHG